MKRAAFGLLALLALPACSAETGTSSADAETISSSACEPAVFEQTPLTHCVADPARHRITTVLAPEEGPPWRSLARYAESRDSAPVAFAMNAGMFDEQGQPIGYYVERGERLHTLNRNEGAGNFHLLPNGVFYGSGSEWHVGTADDFADNVTTRPEFATQSGPMLVIDGNLHPAIAHDGESLKIRNAVGVDAEGRAHFVISEAPLSFGKLARYYRDVLKTPNALFLDGSVSQLWDAGRGRIDGGPDLGPLIVVENRATGGSEKAAP
ncbi:phosphodiester glycosidase family protein [Altericroceibacterium xinjiangense]|uniref:phosphodiester glycosidase family protein n=1 Tax=Altericroceibacterium xinjiangense TaxID=762261 RepID=UPI000F7DC6FB|nr:phosphodiester glycosidase family protein [Altericroceibacterium xinjiangense]